MTKQKIEDKLYGLHSLADQTYALTELLFDALNGNADPEYVDALAGITDLEKHICDKIDELENALEQRLDAAE